MRTLRIFYSWQSDRPSRIGSAFIRHALDAALDALRPTLPAGVSLVLESGTEGVPGTPPVNDTILARIRNCDVFIGDVTFVATTTPEPGAAAHGPKRIPNPNVMAEYGYALHAKGWTRILLAMNAHYGPPEELPFDLHHMRHPTIFAVAPDAADGERRAERARFATDLITHLGSIITMILAMPASDVEAEAKRATEQRLAELVNGSEITGFPVLVRRPKITLHVVPLGEARMVASASVGAVRRLFLPADGAEAVTGADDTEWWAHGPAHPPRPLTNPEAVWRTRLFPDGAIEMAWNLATRQDDDPEIPVDGCALEGQAAAMLSRAAGVLAGLGFAQGALVSLSLTDTEDVHLLAPGAPAKKVRKPSLYLRHVEVGGDVPDPRTALKPLFDRLWLAVGVETGSPCRDAA